MGFGSLASLLAITFELIVTMRRFCDPAVNLCDPMFQGLYHGKQAHEGDMSMILSRAESVGVKKIIITGTSTEESIKALQLAEKLTAELCGREDPVQIYCTAGVHPTSCKEYESGLAEVETKLLDTIASGRTSGRLVAIGEAGLDYDRLQFCDASLQAAGFQHQIDLADRLNLPMFMHNRNTGEDFLRIVRDRRSRFTAKLSYFT